ncbi:unnamed protein product, partial [Ectocarpus sp. 12 AP-2014]
MQTGWLVIEEDTEDALEDETADRCIISCHGSEVLDEAGVREVEGGIQTPPKSAQLQMQANGGRCYSVMRRSRFILVVEGLLADAIDNPGNQATGRPIGNPRGQFSSSIIFGHDGVCEICPRKHSCRRCNNLCLSAGELMS